MLAGEAHGAVDLVRDRGGRSRGLADARLGGGDGEGGVAALGCRARRVGRDARRRDLRGELRDLLLDRLELADRAAELHALAAIAHGEIEHLVERARHLRRPAQRAAPPQRVRSMPRRPARPRPPPATTSSNRTVVARLAGEVFAVRQRALVHRDARHVDAAVMRREHGERLGVARPWHVPRCRRTSASRCRRARALAARRVSTGAMASGPARHGQPTSDRSHAASIVSASGTGERVAARDAQDRHGVAEIGAGAALVLGEPRRGQPRILESRATAPARMPRPRRSSRRAAASARRLRISLIAGPARAR